jgi:hypothetical protein
LEPKRPDGKPHYELDSAEALSKRFISTFDFASVKNYNVHILVENESNVGPMLGYWDEEVEIYDIRGKEYRSRVRFAQTKPFRLCERGRIWDPE